MGYHIGYNRIRPVSVWTILCCTGRMLIHMACSDALGVKLGHRRVSSARRSCWRFFDADTIVQKLQRRIANSRGLAPDASLVSPIRASVEDTRTENTKPEPIKPDSKDVAVVTKRKYRRHPKVGACRPGHGWRILIMSIAG